jgi:hypothetical protein
MNFASEPPIWEYMLAAALGVSVPTSAPRSSSVDGMRRVVPLSVIAALAVAGVAMAQGGVGGDGGDPYGTPEPPVTSHEVLSFAARSGGCGVAARSATVRITPPTGAVLAWVNVRVQGVRIVRLTGIPRAASVTVAVPRDGGRLTATAETLGGQDLKTSRVYIDCTVPAPPPPPVPPPVSGGGDG